MSTAFDVYSRAAHDSVRLPDGWVGVIFTKVGQGSRSQGVMVRGAVCPPKTRGAFKGEPNWTKRDSSTECEVFVSHEAFERARNLILIEARTSQASASPAAQQGRAEA